MAEDRINEIQPQGKQLVFLFMAATVVAVVIFLCGVIVGQSIIVQRGRLLDLAVEAGEDPTLNSLPLLPILSPILFFSSVGNGPSPTLVVYALTIPRT